jgi:S1-C subfamily serine protease
METSMKIVMKIVWAGALAVIACLPNASSQALTIAEIFQRSHPSIVKIRVNCPSSRNMGSTGSGFVVHVREGTSHIVTNHHVVNVCADQRSNIEVIFTDQVRLPARLLSGDRNSDIALLSVQKRDAVPLRFAGQPLETASREPSIAPSQTSGVFVGADVVAIGFPQDLDRQPTVTKGIVSAIGRNLDERSAMIQIDATIDGGSSGGPLFNLDGEVIGVTTSTVGTRNLNFAIPYTIAKAVASDILFAGGFARRGNLPILGTSILASDEYRLRQAGVPLQEGVLVTSSIYQPERRGQVQPFEGALRKCDLIQSIDRKPEAQDIAAKCGGSRACQLVESTPTRHAIRSMGDLNNTLLWIPGGETVTVNIRRYLPQKCDAIAGNPRSGGLPLHMLLESLQDASGVPQPVEITLGDPVAP